MPLTLTASEGIFPKGKEKIAFQKLSEAMLKLHGLSGNDFMNRNVVGSINIIKKEHTYTGSKESDVVFIEWKVPSFAFTQREIQKAYVTEATQIIYDLTEGKHPKENVWINVVHAVDGIWGIGGEAMTNEDLIEAVAQVKN